MEPSAVARDRLTEVEARVRADQIANIVYALERDAAGVLWIGTNKGLSRFDGKQWQTYDRHHGLPNLNVYAIESTADGILVVGKDGKVAGIGDAGAQTKRCLEIIADALREAGAKLEHVVRTRMFMTDAQLWEEVGRAHGEVFGDIRPAATMVEVSGLLDPDWLVEIEAEAVIDDDPADWQHAWAGDDEEGEAKS